MPLTSFIIDALKSLKDPESGQDIVSAGLVQGLSMTTEGIVSFVLDIKPSFIKEGGILKEEAESLIKALPEVKEVYVALTTQREKKIPSFAKENVPGIAHILVVGSGKGGVGKSTTAVNLAYAMHALGLRIGILDADIYGPSLPRLLGITGQPTSDGKTMNPIQAHGLKAMSMGFLVPEDSPMIWRGPMIQKALQQMLRQVHWGELDVLIIDLPPGTGDICLTLAQSTSLSGALIVSTPQDLALIDARKALGMFKTVDVPVLGCIENMSYFLCPHCEGRSDIFEHGGVRREAEKLGVPLLAEIPLHMKIRESAEQGIPLGANKFSEKEAHLYQELAKEVWALLS